MNTPPTGKENRKRFRLVGGVTLGIVLGFSSGAGFAYLWLTKKDPGSKEKTFDVAGEVFLQLATGEAKHAPGCQVYAFNPMSSRGRMWFDIQLKITDAVIQKKLKEKDVVIAFRLALQDVFWKEYPQKHKDSRPTRIEEDRKARTTCDSHGRFVLTLSPGAYIMIAEGRSGYNEAVWITSIFVEAPQRVSLSNPIASYLENP